MSKKFRMSVGVGGPSIIMIFVVLCLTTLSALALMTANADWKLAYKTANEVNRYYAADNEIEELLSELDASLKNGVQPAKDTYFIPVSKTQEMILKLEFEGSDYKIISRKLVAKTQWDYEQYEIEFDDSLTE